MPVTDIVGTYTTSLPVGYVGMEAEVRAGRDVASLVVENAAVAFGLAVGSGAADRSCRLGGTGYAGITLADKTQPADQFAVGAVASVMRKGTVWVNASVAIADTDTPYFVAATGVITNSSSGNVAIPGARFLTSAAQNALVQLYLG